jgi:hypothetical protein
MDSLFGGKTTNDNINYQNTIEQRFWKHKFSKALVPDFRTFTVISYFEMVHDLLLHNYF